MRTHRRRKIVSSGGLTRGEAHSARGSGGMLTQETFTPSEIVSGDEIADPQASQSQTQSFLRAVPLLMRLSQP